MNRREVLFSIAAGLLPTASFSGCSSGGVTDSPAQDLSSLINLTDFETLAGEQTDPSLLAYIKGGAADELTLRWNREAFDRMRLKPKVLVDVSQIDTSIQLLGHQLDSPILLAPVAYQRAIHPEGELATVEGCRLAGSLPVISTATTTSVSEIRSHFSQPFWFQLYARADRAWARALIQHVEDLGCSVLCLTVDNPVSAIRYRERRKPFSLPPSIRAPHMPGNRSAVQGAVSFAPDQLDWEDLEWLLTVCSRPLLLKGILNPDDADQAIRLGVSGIIVSNHGARNLDTVPATIDALPRIVEKVDGRVPVLVDGGIRRGTDIVKAISLGAAAVLIGRPYLYGLAVGGTRGVQRVIDILRKELEVCMAMMGRPTIEELDSSAIWRE